MPMAKQTTDAYGKKDGDFFLREIFDEPRRIKGDERNKSTEQYFRKMRNR